MIPDSSDSRWDLTVPATDRGDWLLEQNIDFLNHGSFGSCPAPVLENQRQWRERLERQPVQLFVRELERLWDSSRALLAEFVGARDSDIVFVPNATSGVNTVLRSLEFEAHDEILVSDHEYNACRNALDYAARRSGARVVEVKIPFPIRSEDEAVDAVLAGVTKRTRLALLDHVTSQTGLVMPVERLIPKLKELGIATLIDGAHAPGMIPLDLKELQPAYYTGNCHKWLCGPKTAAFLYVAPEKQAEVRPLTISHGANSKRTDRSRFLIEFGWMGTSDPSPWLAIPAALEFLGRQLPGGWPELMQRNRALALEGRRILCEALKIPAPAPDSMIGSLASIPLPPSGDTRPPKSPLYMDSLQEELLDKYQIEVPVIPWPGPPARILRISAQVYNSSPQYQRLANALIECGKCQSELLLKGPSMR